MRTHPSGFKVGDRVYFGRGRGEKTLGEITKTHSGSRPLKNLKVKQLESRGTKRSYPVGSVWGVPPSLITRANGSGKPSGPAPSTYKPGDRVMVKGWRGDEIAVTVTKVGTGDTCEVYGKGLAGCFPRTLPVLHKAPARSASEIAEDKRMAESTLDSPEIIWADGERSRTEARRLTAALRRAVRALDMERAA